MGATTNEDVQREPEFPAFPFKPYPIQTQFMRALYDVLHKGGVAMLESPTDWMRDFVPANDNNGCCRNDAAQHNSVQERIRKPRDVRQLGGVLSGVRNGVPTKEIKQNVGFVEGSGIDELDEFLVDDYESGEEGTVKRKAADEVADSEDDENDDRDPKEETEVVPKVYFCSRTHSQLTQFLKDLRKTIFTTEMKVVCLGSRQNMCTNADVLKLGSVTRIHERCLELQKNKKKGNPRCRSKVKLWNMSNSQPSCIGSWKSEVGAVFSVAFSEDRPSLLAIGGSMGKLKTWFEKLIQSRTSFSSMSYVYCS